MRGNVISHLTLHTPHTLDGRQRAVETVRSPCGFGSDTLQVEYDIDTETPEG